MNTPDPTPHSPGPWKAETQGRAVARLVSVPTGQWVAMLGMAYLLNPADVAIIEAAPLMYAVCLAFLQTPAGERHNADLELLFEEAVNAAKGGVP